MRAFEYFAPRSLEEAVDLLGLYDGRASVLAGGTDLLVEMKEHLRTPECVINIKKIPGLDTLHYDAEGGLRIGALTTVRAIERNRDIARHYVGLAEAGRQLASIQVRNRATVAGNICRASPSADMLPPLIADGARRHLLWSARGTLDFVGGLFYRAGQYRAGFRRTRDRDRGACACSTHRQGLSQTWEAEGDGACDRRRSRDAGGCRR